MKTFPLYFQDTHTHHDFYDSVSTHNFWCLEEEEEEEGEKKLVIDFYTTPLIVQSD